MPRSKLGVKRRPINSELLTAAAGKCINGELSIRQAAKAYNVKKTTLTRHVKSYKESGATVFQYIAANNTNQVFNSSEETTLKNYLYTTARLQDGITNMDVRKLAYHYALENGNFYPVSWNKNHAAGKEWLKHFLQRHQDLSLRKPESTSFARLTVFNKANVSSFFMNYKELLSHGNITPERIWNCKETGLTTIHVPTKVIGPNGIKQLDQMTSSEQGQHVAIIAAINAIGNHIPPMMIFPKVDFKPDMLKGTPNGTIGGADPLGWSNELLFLQYLVHFKNHVRPTIENPVILLLDSLDNNVNINAIDFCKNNGILLMMLHSHISHKMELQRTVFGSFKTHYNTACNEWMLMNPGQPISIYDISQLVGKSYPKSFTTSNIQKGFEVSGLCPLNENMFNEHEFLSADITDCPLNKDNGKKKEVNRNFIEVECVIPSTSFAIQGEIVLDPLAPETLCSLLNAPSPKRKAERGQPRVESHILSDTPEKKKILPQKRGQICKKIPTVSKVGNIKHKLNFNDEEIVDLSSSDENTLFDEQELDCLSDEHVKKEDFVIINCESDNHEMKHLRRIGDSNTFIKDSADSYEFLPEDIVYQHK